MRLLRTTVVASVSLGILAARASAQTITAPSQDGSILLIEDLVVGDSEAAGAPLFRRIGDVAVDADGRMYVEPRAVKDGMFYGRRVDANRVETLVRYRIES